MTKHLRAHLARAEGMAFARVADCRELIERFHRLKTNPQSKVQSSKPLSKTGTEAGASSKKGRGRLVPAGLETAARLRGDEPSPPLSAPFLNRPSAEMEKHPDYGLPEKIYAWVFVPLSLWPVDIRGLGLHVLGCIEAGRKLDAETRLMARLLPAAPSDSVCDPVSEYEHAVKSGNYEELIAAQHKFDLMERELAKNPELKADWEAIKVEFKVDGYRNAAGIIRRRVAQERNFRPADWKFAWETEAQRFQNVFDAFCHRWDLWAMEKDRPLLLKLTANLTPYGTIIMVPRYWSFDPRRDLKWKAITRLHRTRSALKQGVKLASNEAARREEAERGRQLWQEATNAGLNGEKRMQWVMGRLGWDARTDDSRLRRMLKRET